MALLPHRRIIIHAVVLSILLLPAVTWGQSLGEKASRNFIPLVGIPYIEGNKVQTFGDYVNALYFVAISIAAFLAVVRIIFAGVKYMLSDIVTTKEEAKKEIKGALTGLLIVIGAVLILDTINPNLKTINVFTNAPVPGIGLEDTTKTTRSPLADERAKCEANGKGYKLIITRTVPEGGGVRDATLTTECCPPEGCSVTSTSTNSTSVSVGVLFEYPKETLDGMNPIKKQEILNLWQNDCEKNRARDVKNAARLKEIEEKLPAGTLTQDVTVVFVKESSPERYTCVQRGGA